MCPIPYKIVVCILALCLIAGCATLRGAQTDIRNLVCAECLAAPAQK